MKIDQELNVKIVEVLSDGALILSYQGKLFQVKNHTQKDYQQSDWLRLRVKKIQPLEFKIIG